MQFGAPQAKTPAYELNRRNIWSGTNVHSSSRFCGVVLETARCASLGFCTWCYIRVGRRLPCRRWDGDAGAQSNIINRCCGPAVMLYSLDAHQRIARHHPSSRGYGSNYPHPVIGRTKQRTPEAWPRRLFGKPLRVHDMLLCISRLHDVRI